MTSPESVPLAFCITDLDPGGAERALVQIATRLDRHAWSPRVYCLMRRGRLADDLEAAGIPVECLGVSSRRDFRVFGRLARLLRRDRPALLQTFLFHANLVGRLAGRWAGVPWIVSGIRVAERRGRWRLWLDRATDRLVDQHVCVSREVAEFSALHGLPRRKLVVIPNGIDFDRFANARPADLRSLGIPEGRRVVLSVARLDPQKGIDVLIDGFTGVASEFPDLELLVVGDGPMRSALVAKARISGFGDRIHFPGYRDDVPALLKAASVFVLTSHWEGMPNAVLEAMAAGCPVVCTRVEGTGDLRGVHRIEPGQTQDVSRAIREVLQNPSAASQVASEAQLHVSQFLTWDKIVSEYDRLYRDLLSR